MENKLRMRVKECFGHIGVVSIIYNAIFMLFILWFCNVSFETNDDNAMANIAYGTTGEYGAHLVFINIFVGGVLKILLNVFPTVPWYSVLMYALMFVGFTVITYILLKKNFFWGTIVSWGILIFYGYDFYTLLQFTKIPAVITTAGILLIFYALEKENINWGFIALAIILLMFGVSYRFSTFGMIFIIMSGYGVWFVFKNWQLCDYRKIIKCVCLFVISIAICFTMRIINANMYQVNEAWSYYKEFNTNRSWLLDFGFPAYDENVELYESVNLTKEDLQLYKSWNFADPEKFNGDVAKALVQEKGAPEITIDYLKGFLEWFPVALLKYEWITAFLVMGLLAIVIDKKNWLWVAYDCFMLLGMQFYFYYIDRYLRDRVDICVFLALTIILATKIVEVAPKVERRNIRKYGCASVLAMFLLSLPLWYEDNSKIQDETQKADALEMSQMIMSDKEHLYINAVGAKSIWNAAYGVWDIIPKGAKSNCYGLGGWTTYAPFTECVKEAYGINNPFADGIDNQEVYYIASDALMQNVCSYIQRNYNENATYVERKNINGYVLYSIVSTPISIDMSKVQEIPENLESNFDMFYDGNVLILDGCAFIKGESSYTGRCYVQAKKLDGSIGIYDLIQYENENYVGDENGQFSMFSGAWDFGDAQIVEVSIYYELDDNIYCIKTQAL